MKRLLTILVLLMGMTNGMSSNAATGFSGVPGTIIDYSPATSGIYLGSPSIAVLPNGDYVVSHDEFGPKSTEHKQAVSQIFSSANGGESWQKIATVRGAFWSTLFVHHGALYLLGTDRHHGNVVIRRSQDGGKTWTAPTSRNRGLLRDNGEYACGATPVLEHNGRVWRAMEWRDPPRAWGINYQAGMMSAPVDADLLTATSWTWSNFLPSNRAWNGGDMTAWLEGNAITNPNGELVNMLRVQTVSPDERAAIVHLSTDGRQASFNPTTDFVGFPGGSKKFTIRYDPQSKLYWSLVNMIPQRHRGPSADSLRNTLAATSSPDLIHWTVRYILLYHPDTDKHGFQYADWLFEGNDIIAACRTAYDDGAGGAHSFHDSNFITFHRITNFRTLTAADSVQLPERVKVTFETQDCIISGYAFEMAKFAEGTRSNSNRKYVWQDVPDALAGRFTRTAGGEGAEITVQTKRASTLHIATALSQPGIVMWGWTPTGETFRYNDKNKTVMTVFTREVQAGEKTVIPQGNWSGGLVLLPGPG